jgi:hypothetical protein
MDNDTSEKRIIVNRQIYSYKKFESEFAIEHDEAKDSTLRKNLSKSLRFVDPRNLLGVFTILNWISEYNFKADLIADLLSGLTGK